MTTEINKQRVRAEVMSRKAKPADRAQTSKQASRVDMWKRAMSTPEAPEKAPLVGVDEAKAAMWSKAVRGKGA